MRDAAVIIIHGIQGHSRLFSWMEEGLDGRADVYNMLLPGHGGTVQDFIHTDMRRWQAFVDERAVELRKRYRRLYYAGHSMGCLLGLDAARRHPGIFDGMVLIACPLRVRITWRYIKYNFLAALHGQGGDEFVRAAREGNGVHPKNPAEYLLCGRQFAQLFRKVRAVRKNLKEPGFPVLAFQAEKDEIVDGRSIKYFAGMENVKTNLLPGCGHNYYNGAAREKILQQFRKMIN